MCGHVWGRGAGLKILGLTRPAPPIHVPAVGPLGSPGGEGLADLSSASVCGMISGGPQKGLTSMPLSAGGSPGSLVEKRSSVTFRARLGLWPRAPAAVTTCTIWSPRILWCLTRDFREGSRAAGVLRLVWPWLFQVHFPRRPGGGQNTDRGSRGWQSSGAGASVSGANVRSTETLPVGRKAGVCRSRGGLGEKPPFGGVSARCSRRVAMASELFCLACGRSERTSFPCCGQRRGDRLGLVQQRAEEGAATPHAPAPVSACRRGGESAPRRALPAGPRSGTTAGPCLAGDVFAEHRGLDWGAVPQGHSVSVDISPWGSLAHTLAMCGRSEKRL